MKVIYKYPLKVTDEQQVTMPADAAILTVQVQNGQPFLWAMIDNTCGPMTERKISIIGTGNLFRTAGRYIGTFQMHDGLLVFHVFEGI